MNVEDNQPGRLKMLNIFINVWRMEQCTLSKFADGTKISGVVDASGSHSATQRDMDRLKSWAYRIVMKFNKEKHRVLHLWENDLRHQDMLGATKKESKSAEMNLSILVDIKLNVNNKCELAGKQKQKTKQTKPNKNLNHPGAALSEIMAADWGRCSFLSVQHCWDHTGRIVSSSGFCSTRDTRSFWKESNTGPWRWWRDCNIYPYNEGLRELEL